MEDGKQIIEINGVKLEVDMRYARRIEELRVGSRVKVLKKGFGDSWDAFSGVVVGFEPFPERPTIIIAYVKSSYSECALELAHFHKDSKDLQIVAALDDDFSVSRKEVLGWFDREQQKLDEKRREIDAKRQFFLDRFQAYWTEDLEPRANV